MRSLLIRLRQPTGFRLKSTSSSSSSTAQLSSAKPEADSFKKSPLFKADDVIVAEVLRNAQYHQTNSNLEASADISNHGDCQRCGKPLKPPQTVNTNQNLLQCSECQMMFSSGGGSSTVTHKNETSKTNDYLKRPPYPSEVS